jgi:hypothetical protein
MGRRDGLYEGKNVGRRVVGLDEGAEVGTVVAPAVHKASM